MLEQRTQEIDELVLGNLDLIEDRMHAYAFVLATGEGPQILAELGSDIEILNPQRTTLSEMPICGSLYLFAKLFEPLGFTITSGSILFNMDEKTNGLTNHTYLSTPFNNEIVCFTPGQFVDSYHAPEKKGAKIEALVQSAPSLVRRLNNEVAILRGEFIEINDLLDLLYLPNPIAPNSHNTRSQVDSQLILH